MSLARLATVLLLLVLGATPALAQGRRVSAGSLLWRSAQQEEAMPAPLLATEVEMRVTGVVVRGMVRQQFANPSGDWAEGVYVFPLPEDAAVDHLRMLVGDRIVEGVIQERAAARAAYAQARQEGKRGGLVEQERPNVFTTSVANIPPGAAIAIEIEYQQAVRHDGEQLGLRFPMVVGPRYIPGPVGTDQGPDASRITPPVQHTTRGATSPVTLRIELDPGVPLAGVHSPSHAIHTRALRGGRYEIELEQVSVPADRDFQLVWTPVMGAAPAAAVLAEDKGDEIFALLMVMPPAPPVVEADPLPREVVFVLDQSGSMGGASIEQARAALTLALARLRPADRFNVIRFNHTTDRLFAHAQPADRGNVVTAQRYVAAIRAEGGTEMLPALQLALDGADKADRLRQVIFLTDGAVGNEARLFQAIRERLGDSRLFTVGIGSAPNSHFMREAARLGRGTFTYIGDTAEVKERMTGLFRKLQSPALTDVRLELPGAGDAEILPGPIPDLYLGEPIVVAVRTRMLPSEAVVRGRFGSTPWESRVPLQQAAPGSGLSVHWAADTWPVARLRVPVHGIDLIVLDGVSGRTLAFGPGHAGGSARPGAPGTAIVSGHRDTHFRFLQRVTPGEEIVVETPGRPAVRFHVREATVVDARTAVIGSAGDGTVALVLLTCYPFDAVNPGGPLRYVVVAEAASAEARRISSE